MNSNIRKGLLYLIPVNLFILIFFVVPVISMFNLSFLKWSPNKQSVFIFFDNYAKLFNDPKFFLSFYNTLLYTLIVTPIIFLMAFFFATVLRKATQANVIYRVIFFIPFTISFVASSYIWLWLLSDVYGILNYVFLKIGIISQPFNFFSDQITAIIAVSIMVSWKTQGFSMILLLAGLSTIPSEVYESAAIDGAGKVRTFLSITIPLLRPTIVLALILSLAGSFRAFDHFYIMTNGNPLDRTMTILMYINKVGFEFFEVGKSAAASVIFALFLLSLSVLQLKVGRYGND